MPPKKADGRLVVWKPKSLAVVKAKTAGKNTVAVKKKKGRAVSKKPAPKKSGTVVQKKPAPKKSGSAVQKKPAPKKKTGKRFPRAKYHEVCFEARVNPPEKEPKRDIFDVAAARRALAQRLTNPILPMHVRIALLTILKSVSDKALRHSLHYKGYGDKRADGAKWDLHWRASAIGASPTLSKVQAEKYKALKAKGLSNIQIARKLIAA